MNKKGKPSLGLSTALFLLINLLFQWTWAQSTEILKIREQGRQQNNHILDEFKSFLSIPNTVEDTENLLVNAHFIMGMMKGRGMQNVQFLPVRSKGIPPVVYGEVIVPGAEQTVVFYAHYDGQPVNAAQWSQGLGPFQPVIISEPPGQGPVKLTAPYDIKDNNRARIFARSSSDDKVGVAAILNAYGALVSSGLKPGSNLKFFFEGEEESGSVHLSEVLEEYSSLLQSDLWIICDGPVHQTGIRQIFFGVRGVTGLELTVYASKRPLHSGHYGNWAPNPALMLSHLLASMKDENGKVLIHGFYEDALPLSPSEIKALQESPRVEEKLKKELGIMSAEQGDMSLMEAISKPALNIVGIESGNTGRKASNQIPSVARANLDLRLVPGNDWRKQQQKIIDHIRSEGYYITDKEPTDEERGNHGKIIKISGNNRGYNAHRTSMDLTISKKIIEAVQSTTPEKIVLQPTMGASLPLIVIAECLQAEVVIVPVANHDNNQHAADENLRLQNLFDGIETMAGLMMIR